MRSASDEYLERSQGTQRVAVHRASAYQTLPLIRLLAASRVFQVTACDKKNREDLGRLWIEELESLGACLQLGARLSGGIWMAWT